MTGLGYTAPAAAAVAAVVAAELAVLRTGLFRRPAYWVTMLIVFAFQIPVDGWLTKLSAPVVEYSSRQMTGLRGPLDIPLEDFLFGFALVTAALLLWERQGRPAAGQRAADPGTAGRAAGPRTAGRAAPPPAAGRGERRLEASARAPRTDAR